MNTNPRSEGYFGLDHDDLGSITDQIAQAVWDCELECTGCSPEGVSVILNNDILVIKRHKALAPPEGFLAGTGRWLHGFPRHRLLTPSNWLWKEIERITGRQLYECTEKMDLDTVKIPAFLGGALVQVFRLI